MNASHQGLFRSVESRAQVKWESGTPMIGRLYSRWQIPIWMTWPYQNCLNLNRLSSESLTYILVIQAHHRSSIRTTSPSHHRSTCLESSVLGWGILFVNHTDTCLSCSFVSFIFSSIESKYLLSESRRFETSGKGFTIKCTLISPRYFIESKSRRINKPRLINVLVKKWNGTNLFFVFSSWYG